MVTFEDFTDKMNTSKMGCSNEVCFAHAEDTTRRKIMISGLLAPAKQYLGGNPLDGYPLGLPAGVAGGLSGK